MIQIFGLGAAGLPSLSAGAAAALATCRSLFGGRRHLALIPDGPAKFPWPKPWSLPVQQIAAARGPVGVLVSGDPSWYSAATALQEHFKCQVWPVPGAFSLAAARLGWALETVTTGSIHGRQVRDQIAALRTGGRHLILADRNSLAALVAGLQPPPAARLTLLCNLGGADEQCMELDPKAPVLPETDLFTIAADLPPPPRLPLDADFLPDAAFATQGKSSKFAARQLAVAALARGKILWDVGAGAGTVGLQAAHSLHTDCAYFIEEDPQALRVLSHNCAQASATSVIVKGRAPQVLADLDAPDAVFIGGGLKAPALLAACWQILQSGGRLVAQAVTLESEAVLLAFFQAHPQAQLHRYQFSQADPVGGLHGWRPAMPLTQLVVQKS